MNIRVLYKIIKKILTPNILHIFYYRKHMQIRMFGETMRKIKGTCLLNLNEVSSLVVFIYIATVHEQILFNIVFKLSIRICHQDH